MAHVIQQVRDETKARLETLQSLRSVFSNRGADLLDEHLPAAVIQTPDDDSEKATKEWKGHEPHQRRTIQLFIVLVVAGGMEDVDDELDAIRVDVEKRMDDGDLGGLAKRVELVSGARDIGQDEDGELWYAFLALGYEVEVWTERGDPETAL